MANSIVAESKHEESYRSIVCFVDFHFHGWAGRKKPEARPRARKNLASGSVRVRSVRKKTLEFGNFQRFLAFRWNSPERPFFFAHPLEKTAKTQPLRSFSGSTSTSDLLAEALVLLCLFLAPAFLEVDWEESIYSGAKAAAVSAM